MRTSDFDYSLPADLIAQRPPAVRGESRLLSLNGRKPDIEHLSFSDFPSLLSPDDLLIFNNTRVIPARLWAKKTTGGNVEILVERILDHNRILAHLKSSRPTATNSLLNLFYEKDGLISDFRVLIESESDGLFVLKVINDSSASEVVDHLGHIPLPPYIDRNNEDIDRDRYQTVFAKIDGAIAAPTAGLHFTKDLLEKIRNRGVRLAEITLHVGSGTFRPVRVDSLDDHSMHSERIHIDGAVSREIGAAKKRGGRVVAIGTTTVRALETTNLSGLACGFTGESQIFIYPGYVFKCVDALLTNFHLPRSTLLMLVSAFAGRERVLNAYQEAILKRYRFFSYGDAMFIGRPSRDNS